MIGDILETLRMQSIRFVRVVWCDNANVIRGKAIHYDALPGRIDVGVGLSAAQQAIPIMVDAIAPNSGLAPVGEVWLIPDWSTLRPLPYAPGHARVIGDMVHNQAPWPWCGRQFLRRMIQQAADLGLEIQAVFEPEFYLLRQIAGEINPADQTAFAATLGMDYQQSVMDAIADALTDQGIAIEQYYPESGPGQQELSIHYAPALQAADQHLIYRETVHAVAHRHGLVASFLPKIFAQTAGSGCHLHLSLWQGGENITPAGAEQPGKLSPTARAFVAGLLDHLPALMAITTPSTNSYRRLQPHFWSGAFRTWGYDNREAAVRIPSNPTLPSPTHIELKTVDGAANPYLALGCAIAAGLDGLRRHLDLGEPAQIDPGSLSPAERDIKGWDRLPPDLNTAITHFANDTVLQDTLGNPLATALLAIRRMEWEAMHTLSLEEEVRLLLEKY